MSRSFLNSGTLIVITAVSKAVIKLPPAVMKVVVLVELFYILAAIPIPVVELPKAAWLALTWQG